MAHTFQQEYMEMPPITRAYTTACVLTTIAVVSFNYLFFFAAAKFVFKLSIFQIEEYFDTSHANST